MAIHLWIFIIMAILAAVDLVIVASLYFHVRASPPPDRKTLNATAFGLSGFVVHALMFFEGVFLVIQLTVLAGIIGIYYLRYLDGQKKQTGLRDDLA